MNGTKPDRCPDGGESCPKELVDAIQVVDMAKAHSDRREEATGTDKRRKTIQCNR